MLLNSIPDNDHKKKSRVYPYRTATMNASKNRQLKLRITTQSINKSNPWNMYSTTPTVNKLCNGNNASEIIKAGAVVKPMYF